MKTKIFMALASVLILLPSIALAQGGWVSLPAQAFIPVTSTVEWTNSIFTSNYLYPIGTLAAGFVAPIVFPPEADGLSVRQMNVTVRDSDDSTNITVSLYRQNRYSGANHLVYQAMTSIGGTPGKIVLTDTAGGYRLIDNSKYVWLMYIYFSGTPSPPENMRLYAVRIQYQ